ncbi:MAG TPA: sulfite exporter TauE/SafE family protein [Acidimicrobiales bacterium]|nr:sulfite exporter TauE/SafE family protein [Acidimicrobiales bacterium]
MMDDTPLHALLTIVAGVATGVLSAAFGVGGAVLSTPAIRLLGVSAAFAVGTTLPSILPSAATGTWRYTRERLVRWRVVAWTTPPGALAAVGGSLLSQEVPGKGHWLMILTAALLGVTAWRMARSAPPRTEVPPAPEAEQSAAPAHLPPSDAREHPAVLAAVGTAAGLLSGLLGVGGGIVLVPGFTEAARIPIKPAIATSLVCVGLFAVPATLAHSHVGDIDWRTAVLLSVGVVPGARLGAHLAVRASEARLRRAVAAFMGIVAVAYALSEATALAPG